MLLECRRAGHRILDLPARQAECRLSSNIRHQLHRHIHQPVPTINLEHRQVHHIPRRVHPTAQPAQSILQHLLIILRHRQITIRRHRATRQTLLILHHRLRIAQRVRSIKQRVLFTLRHIRQRVLTRRRHLRTALRRRFTHQRVQTICRQARTIHLVRHRSRQQLQAIALRVQITRHKLRCTHHRALITRHHITHRALHLILQAQQSTVPRVQAIHQLLRHIARHLNTHRKVHQATIRQQARVIQVHQAAQATLRHTLQAEAQNIHRRAQFTARLHLFTLRKTQKQVLHTQAQRQVAQRKNSNNSLSGGKKFLLPLVVEVVKRIHTINICSKYFLINLLYYYFTKWS